MFNKIFLHIGLPKTGTTYLENAFDALSREALYPSGQHTFLAPTPKAMVST